MMRTVSIVKFCLEFCKALYCSIRLYNDCNIASYADGNTAYARSRNLDAAINKLEESIKNMHQWFRSNHMKSNPDKCHLLVTGNYETSADINEFEIEIGKKEKLLGISIDRRIFTVKIFFFR